MRVKKRWKIWWLTTHLMRQGDRTLLTAALAVSILIGVGYLRHAMAANQVRIDHLYRTVEVSGELLQENLYLFSGGGIIPEDLAERLEKMGYFSQITKVIGGTVNAANDAFSLPSVGPGGKRTDSPGKEDALCLPDVCYQAVWRMEDCEAAQKGWIEIAFREGMDSPEFAGADKLQAVLSTEALYALGLQVGDKVLLDFGGCRQWAEIVGPMTILDERVTYRVLLNAQPLVELFRQSGTDWAYASYAFTIDPVCNRELPKFRAAAEELVASKKNPIALFLLLRDGELTQAVEPLERNVTLLRVLYPVMLALAVVIAAGVAALLVSQSTRNMAILRMLGVPAVQTGTLTMWQQIVAAAVGVIVGLLLAMCLLGGNSCRAAALCGGLFLAGSITGSAAAAVGILQKNPMELLQVKE